MRQRWWVGSLALLLLGVVAGARPGVADSPYDDVHYERYGPNNAIRLRLGVFTPDANDAYFRGVKDEFTGDPQDLQDAVGGFDYELDVSRHLGLLFSTDYFQGRMDNSYRGYVDDRGHRITHQTSLEITPVTAGLVVKLAPEQAPVVPYIGGGGGLYWWRLRESGDFIDFGTQNLDVFHDTFEDSGGVLGYYLVAGVDVPISPYFSVFGEARWDRAHDELGQDFQDFGTLDLSGRRVMGGVAWHF